MCRNTFTTLIFLIFLILLIWVGALALLGAFMPEASAMRISIVCAVIVGILLLFALRRRGFGSRVEENRRVMPTYHPAPVLQVANVLNTQAVASMRSTSSVVSAMVMTVRLVISMPAIIRLGARVALEVQVAMPPDRPVPAGSGEVKFSIFSPGFRLLSGHIRRVDVSLVGGQSTQRFDLEAHEEGTHNTRVSAFVGGTWAGSTTFESKVKADAETGQPTSKASTIQIGTPEDGEVTLEVNFDEAHKAYSYQLNSATFREDRMLSRTLQKSPLDLIDFYVNQLSLYARNQSTDTAAEVDSMGLSGIGIRLWRDFIPDELNQKYWERRSEIKRLTILSEGSGHLIPWEAMYPISRTGEKAGYLVDQVTVVRQSYAFMSQPTDPFHFSEICFVLSDEDDPPKAKQEVNRLEAILHGKQSEVTDTALLTGVLDAASFNLLHFACHNVFGRGGSDESTGPYIPLGIRPFDTNILANYISQFKQSPLVFMNVCRSDGGSPGYTRIINWADSFLETGVRAFIGTLWEVRDDTASMFAEYFYQALVSGASLGEAMHQARSKVRDRAGDPTWLAYTLYGDPKATAIIESTPGAQSTQSGIDPFFS